MAQTIATFNGTLLRRERTEGKPFVQLVFREAEKDWLCLSSNLANVKLQLGKQYHIEGLFKSLGGREYIHEPEILPIARQIARRRIIISVAAGLIVLLTVGGIVMAATHHSAAPASKRTATAAVGASDTSSASDTPSDTTTTNTSTDTSTNPATTSLSTTLLTSGTPAATPTPSTPVVTPPPSTPAATLNAPALVAGDISTDGTSVDLSWNASDGATAYQLFRDGVLFDTVTGTGDSDTTLQPGDTYDYKVFAVAGSSESAASNTVTVTVPAADPGP